MKRWEDLLANSNSLKIKVTLIPDKNIITMTFVRCMISAR